MVSEDEDLGIIRETYLDYNGNPAVGEEGFVSREKTVRNKKVVTVRWYDESGNPSTCGDTYYQVDYTYDKIGNINREKYYDLEGNLIRCLKGYAIVYREYDAFNRIVYEKFYDTDGFAIMLEDGAVSYRYEYDDDGNLIRTTKYDYADKEVE